MEDYSLNPHLYIYQLDIHMYHASKIYRFGIEQDNPLSNITTCTESHNYQVENHKHQMDSKLLHLSVKVLKITKCYIYIFMY